MSTDDVREDGMDTGVGGSGSRPVAALFDEVVGQAPAVAQLTAAARRPVHAYLLHGPPGSGKRAAARGLTAALLCPEGGCGECSTCRRALGGVHPDLVVVERTGATLDVDEARIIVARAQRRPMEGARQVLVVHDVHLAGKAAPALLKTVEEPPPSTVFILLADATPPSLATIVSRCVQIPFSPVPRAVIVSWLVGRGVDPGLAESVAEASGGRLDRARLLAGDPGFAHRQERWHSVPTRLDGTGSAAAVVAAELLAAADEALAPLRAEHAAAQAALVDQAGVTGSKGAPGRKHLEDAHKREERRWRTDELRFGLATLASAYRDRLVASVGVGAGSQAGGGSPDQLAVVHSPGAHAESRRAARHVDAIRTASVALGRNANEALVMDALMVELSGILD